MDARTLKQSIRCMHKERKMSGRGGFPSVWYVQCKKDRTAGRIYCAEHAAQIPFRPKSRKGDA